MKTLYIDCGMGCAGDMLTGALLELFEDKDSMVKELNQLGIPGVIFHAEQSVKCGIGGTHMRVEVNGEEEGEHAHHHGHEHAHEHHHSSMHEIEHIVMDHIQADDVVKNRVMRIYNRIASAEGKVHGVPVEEIHFHEVGAMDAIADITAVSYLIERLGIEQIVVSPVHVGSGTVKCAHGILPVPAPATAILLEGVPIYSKEVIRGELCTPTGAALLTELASRFGEMPVMTLEKTGYGMGRKDFPIANCVRVLLGETGENSDEVVELRFNVDDMTAEEIAFAHDALLESGAFEVFRTNVQMKKNRPGTLFTVLTTEKRKEEVIRAVFRHTTTLGMREFHSSRYILNRRIVRIETPYGIVRRKESEGYGVHRYKYEYDDLARIAKEQNCSVYEARSLVEKFLSEA